MKRRLRIIGLSNQDTAVYWYRIIQPLQGIGRQKLASVHHLPLFGTHAGYLTSVEFREYQALEGKWGDVLFTTIGSDQYYLSVILAMKERYGLTLVVDLDDDILSTQYEPTNPAFAAYMGSGKHAEYAQYCLSQADLVTVSTDYLAKKYAPLCSNIVIVPNCTDPRYFVPPPLSPELVIGYAGSGSHQKDWEMVEPVLRKVKERYGVKVKVLGPIVTDIADYQVSWVDTLRYPESLASLGMSIGIAPLRDSAMARGKSNLRWLEYSALKVPTIASDVVPFRGMRSVLLASEPEDWERHLVDLIEHPEKRTVLGESAYNESRTNYSIDTHARHLFDAIDRIHNGVQVSRAGLPAGK